MIARLDRRVECCPWILNIPVRIHSGDWIWTSSLLGESHLDKIKRLREVLSKKDAKALVVSMLDEVAWLFNLRGADIAYNPVFFAYAIITQEKVTLFVEPDQLDEDARRSLGDQITIQSYSSFFDTLRGLAKELDLGEKSVSPCALM